MKILTLSALIPIAIILGTRTASADSEAFIEVQGTVQNPVTYFVVDGPQCRKLYEKIAEFPAGSTTPKAIQVQSGKRIYVLINHHLGYQLDRQGNPVWSMECKSLQSFVPESGSRYTVLPRMAVRNQCSASIFEIGGKGFAPGFKIEKESNACN